MAVQSHAYFVNQSRRSIAGGNLRQIRSMFDVFRVGSQCHRTLILLGELCCVERTAACLFGWAARSPVAQFGGTSFQCFDEILPTALPDGPNISRVARSGKMYPQETNHPLDPSDLIALACFVKVKCGVAQACGIIAGCFGMLRSAELIKIKGGDVILRKRQPSGWGKTKCNSVESQWRRELPDSRFNWRGIYPPSRCSALSSTVRSRQRSGISMPGLGCPFT